MNSVINYATTYEPRLAGNKLVLGKMFSLDSHPEYQELNPIQGSGAGEAGPLGTEIILVCSQGDSGTF